MREFALLCSNERFHREIQRLHRGRDALSYRVGLSEVAENFRQPSLLTSKTRPLLGGAMIDFEAVIRRFGPRALAFQLREAQADGNAIQAMQSLAVPDRVGTIRSWLQSYQVFQGIPGPKRSAIAEAVLEWGDSRDERLALTTLDALVDAHAGLMAACSAAEGRGRDFTSLASKALWLRCPEVVPLFDSFAQRTLWVISKIERDVAPPSDAKSEYRRFAYVWKALFDRYAEPLAAIDVQGYPYRVRIFDKILWIIGTPGYGA